MPTIFTRIEGNRARRLRITARNELLWAIAALAVAALAATGAVACYVDENAAGLAGASIVTLGCLAAAAIRFSEFRRHLDLHETELSYQTNREI